MEFFKRPQKENVPEGDISFILEKFDQIVGRDNFRNESILLTGGTGFFGKWLTQAILAMNDRWQSNNHLTILTRDAISALIKLPWLNSRNDVALLESDVRKFAIEHPTKFSIVIHGAAAASQDLNFNHPEVMFDTIVEGTKSILSIAEQVQCRRFQLISSGAVYGSQPPDLSHVTEDYLGGPNTMDQNSSYGEGKRAAELLAACSARRCGFHLTVPRCYAFLGPYLPLDTHFAAGNFLNSVLKNETIRIGGDGRPYRSYMYAADLVVWLLSILLNGNSGRIYNVGSDHAVSIRELAESTDLIGRDLFDSRSTLSVGLEVAQKSSTAKPPRYVPSIERAKSELNLDCWTDLPSAIEKTLKWHSNLS